MRESHVVQIDPTAASASRSRTERWPPTEAQIVHVRPTQSNVSSGNQSMEASLSRNPTSTGCTAGHHAQQHPWGPSRAHGHADLSRGHIPLTVCLGHLISPSVRISSTRFGGRRPVRLQLASRHARSRRSPHPLPAARLTRGQNASGTHQHRAHPLTPPRPTSVRRRLVGWLLCLCLPLVTPERPSSSSVC